MGKNKLAKFAEMETFTNVFQVTASEIGSEKQQALQGNWGTNVFKNNHPIVLELGCGKGEYTIALAQLYPEKNFIGVDIKGARLWKGAKQALDLQLPNAVFLRTNIEMIDSFFAANEVSEIWLTFPDPQMKKASKRLTSTYFMSRYQHFMRTDGLVHLKTDSNFMFTYTTEMVKANDYPVLVCTNDLYNSDFADKILSIKTYYEQQWLSRGLSIKYIQFKLEQRNNFVEPEVEIERDAYRSFGRNAKINTITTD